MKFVWTTKANPLLPKAGDQSYSNGLMRSLIQAGAEGILVTYDNAATDQSGNVPGLQKRLVQPPQIGRAGSVVSSLPSDAFKQKTKTFAANLLAALTQDVDVLVVDYYAMGWVLPTVRRHIGSWSRKPAIIYISHNFEQRLRPQVARAAQNPLLRAALIYDATKAVHLEHQLVAAADLIVANTDDDKAAYLAQFPSKAAITLTPAYNGTIAPTRPIDASLPRRVVVSGSFDWVAKRAALKRFVEVASGPFSAAGIELVIVGAMAPDIAREIADISPKALTTGWVDQLGPHISKARIGVMPDEVGGGFKHKYMDYIFNGAAVGTIRSQAQGLPLDIERDLIARDDVPSLVGAIVEAIDDIPLLEGKRERAWAACHEAFSWTERGVRFRRALDELLASRE